ncbi:hypothetical protein [Microbacterium sp. NPDC091662]|uniref:DUF7927 domain-containing protein n=1 Tax=Microbacterium sp. NPDC091662 TaxID=3364211 RepID=UPI00381A76E3
MSAALSRLRSRGLWGGIAAALMVSAGLVATSVATAPAAHAAPVLQCTGSTVYATNQSAGDGDLWMIDGVTGAATAQIDLPGGDVVNQLGIAPGGGNFFFTKAGVVYDYTLATDSFVSTPAQPLTGYSAVGGAVSPTTGLYYYGGLGVGGTEYRIAVYDSATNTNQGIAATIRLPDGITLGNSDFAFDTLGQMYILGSTPTGGALIRVDGSIPSTGSNPTLTSSLLTAIEPVAGVSYAAIAFGGAGEVYIGGGAGPVLRVNATTGALIGSAPVTGAAGALMTDFASCGAPPTLTVQKHVAGRVQPTDQFALSITGGGIVPGPGSSGVTEGTEIGLQTQSPSETAGSVIVQPNTAYDFAEAGAGTANLADYASRWECVDAQGDAGSTISTGTGPSGSITIPQAAGIAVVCTVFNDPLVPGMTLDKRVTDVIDANGNGYHDVGDQIIWEFELTNTGETELTGLTIDDDRLAAAGIGVTCDPDALAPAESVVCTADRPYTITAADLDAGAVVNTATGTGTPPGKPPVITPPDTTETPVGSYTVIKKSDPASGSSVAAGSVITYTLTVTQRGLAAVPGAVLEDDLTAVLDDAAYNGDASASAGTVSFDETTGTLSWGGDLAAGDVVTITYSVTVGTRGDGDLVNTVTGPGCSTACTTTHDRVPPPAAGLATTGGGVLLSGIVGALLVIAVGAGLVFRRRGRVDVN